MATFDVERFHAGVLRRNEPHRRLHESASGTALASPMPQTESQTANSASVSSPVPSARKRPFVDREAVRSAAAAEWQRSPAVRQEFRGDEGAFVAYQVAAASGQVHVAGGEK